MIVPPVNGYRLIRLLGMLLMGVRWFCNVLLFVNGSICVAGGATASDADLIVGG